LNSSTAEFEAKFTFEQYLNDVKENATAITNDKFINVLNDQKIYFSITENDDITRLAKATINTSNNYSIYINSYLLRQAYEFLDNEVRSYYRKIKSTSSLTEELYLRTIGGIISELFFWHEYSHIARGHLGYLKHVKNSNTALSFYERLVEIDADVYGASFLLVRWRQWFRLTPLEYVQHLKSFIEKTLLVKTLF
jgi:hypothetical protein